MSRSIKEDYYWRRAMAKEKEQPKQPSRDDPTKQPRDPKQPPIQPQGDVDNPAKNPPPPPPGGGGD